MRFEKGVYYSHPPRGPGRRPYHVSEAARRARRLNLSKTRTRSSPEIQTIKLWIWQDTFGDGPHLSQRELARQLGVSRSYIHKVQHQGAEAIDALTRGPRVTMDDLAAAQRFSAKLREQEPNSLRAVRDSLDYDRRPTAELPTVHAPGCRCDACICPECEKQRDPHDAAGHVLLSNRCLCVRHGQNCGCASCQIARAITLARAETTPNSGSR